jgi:hypothetical protein
MGWDTWWRGPARGRRKHSDACPRRKFGTPDQRSAGELAPPMPHRCRAAWKGIGCRRVQAGRRGFASGRRARGGDPPSLPPIFRRDLALYCHRLRRSNSSATVAGRPAASHGPSLLAVPPPGRARIRPTPSSF